MTLIARAQRCHSYFKKLNSAASTTPTVPFHANYKQFLHSIETARGILLKSGKNRRQKAGGIEEEKGEEEQRLVEGLSDIVLAASLSAILHLWEPPLCRWKRKDLFRGIEAFRNAFSDNSTALVESLDIQSPDSIVTSKCTFLDSERLHPIDSFLEEWHYLNGMDIYSQPVRFLLREWVLATKQLITRYFPIIRAMEWAGVDNLSFIPTATGRRWREEWRGVCSRT
jgi:hypothetical protein